MAHRLVDKAKDIISGTQHSSMPSMASRSTPKQMTGSCTADLGVKAPASATVSAQDKRHCHERKQFVSRSDFRGNFGHRRCRRIWPSEVSADVAAIGVLVCAFLLAFFVSSAIQVADEWSKAVVLRLASSALLRVRTFHDLPISRPFPIGSTPAFSPVRQSGEDAHKDTVPVDVDAVLFWKIIDPERPPSMSPIIRRDRLGVANRPARLIGKTMLSDMLEGRDKISPTSYRRLSMCEQSPGVSMSFRSR